MTVIFIYHELPHYGAGVALTNLEAYHRSHGIQTALLYLYGIKDLSFLNRYKDPVVVCNTILSYPIVQALSKTNVPTYWYIHEWIDETHNWLNHFNPNIFHTKIKPIFVCNKSFENYKQRLPHLNNPIIMYNGVSKDVLHVKSQQFKVPRQQCLTIAIISSIAERKNQQAFIDNVYSKLVQPVHLILVGRILMKLNIEHKNITMVGHVDNAIPYIMAADIIVSYSLNEVLPMHIIESFYCKKPVIATNVGGISEMIDGTNGFLIEPNDSIACISRINELRDAGTREKIGDNAHNTFLTKFESSVTFKLLS
jgi:glycosyltransferase involved in cell wall biosynthesis